MKNGIFFHFWLASRSKLGSNGWLVEIKRFVFMKKGFGVFIALVLMPSVPANAWSGGPFGNNNGFSQGDDGVYEAVAVCSNGMGLYRFGVRNQPSTTANNAAGTVTSNVEFNAGVLTGRSTNVWYYRGITYIGSCVGSVSSVAGTVSVVGNAQADVVGTALTNTDRSAREVNSTEATNGFSNATNYFQSPVGGNVGFANSFFSAKLGPKGGPAMTFKGSGTVSFVGNNLSSTTITRNYTTNTGGLGGTNGVNAIANSTTVTEVILTTEGSGDNSSFKQRGSKHKFRVTGSRVSTVVSSV
ncbi:MAG: hypothetical protein H7A54_17885 [Akkermansiaceae bacterium]|nr:hypothetical protein [Akkermansiaceae bacterium]